MANDFVTASTAVTVPAAADVLYLGEESAGSYSDGYITLLNLMKLVTNGSSFSLARGYLITGSATGFGTTLDAGTDTYMLLGDGDDLNSVEMTGDCTISNTGVIAIGDGKVLAAELGVTAGTVTASRALVVDASKDIATLHHVTLNGNLVIGTTTLSETDLAKIDAITNGTAAASKAVVLDASKNINGIGSITSDSAVITNVSVGTSGTAGNLAVYPATANKGNLTLHAIDNAADHYVTITNASHGQASTYSLPDSGLASAYLVSTTAALSIAEADTLQGAVAGTQAASKVVLPDANVNIGVVKATELHIGATSTETQVTATGTELNYLDLTTGAGTAELSKAVVLDASADVTGINSLMATTLNAGKDASAGTINVFPATTVLGKIAIAAVDNGGNHTITITNASHGQASTYTFPDSGLATAYLVSTTTALSVGEADVLEGATAGTAVASKAVVLDASKDTSGINVLGAVTVNATDIDAGASGTAGTVDVFPTTGSKGKLSLAAVDSAADHTVTISNASHGQASVYTIPDVGAATGYLWSFAAAQTAQGVISRADLVQNDLARYEIPFYAWRVHDAPQTNLPGTSADDDLGLYGTTIGTNPPYIATSDLKAEGGNPTLRYARATVKLPAEYVDGQTITIRFKAGMITTIADDGCTLDLECYLTDDEDGVGADICTTGATTINSLTWANIDFTITPTSVVAGDTLDLRVRTSVSDAATGTAVIAGFGTAELLCDVKG